MSLADDTYRLLFERNPQPMWVFDAGTLAFLAVNDAAVAHYGYSREEFLRMTLRDIRPPGELPRLEEYLQARAPGLAGASRWQHRRRDGTLFDVEVSSHDITFEGRPARLTLLRDVTAQRQAEEALRESEERFRTAFESAPVGMALVSPEGRLTRVNRALCVLLGWTEAELRQRTLGDVTHPEDVAGDVAGLEGVVAGELPSFRHESRYRHRDGHLVWGRLSVALVRSREGAPLYLVAQVEDITERRRLREQLEQRAQELERSNRELQDFASIASHDLQEPLRKVQLFGDRLHQRFSPGLGEQGQDYLRRMREAARRMQTLIQDLLAYSRVGTQAPAFARVDLDEVARGVVADLEGLLHATGGRVELTALPEVEADATQMRQLLQNLLGNALKFHREGVPPRVRVAGTLLDAQGRPAAARQGAVQLELRVEDDGIGFDERYVDRIFAPFQRLHGRGEYEGTGIGLAIARRIAERHHGHLTARSAPGAGATFLVTLPLRQVPPAE